VTQPLPPNDVDVERPLALTPEQRRQFDEDGFFLVEDLLSAEEVAELLEKVDELYPRLSRERDVGADEPFQMRNIVALDRRFRDLIDHPRILPLVVDVMGCNIQLRTSHADVRPPQPQAVAQHALGAPDSFFPWHSDGPNWGWPLVDGVVPFMEMKVGLYLTDLSEGNCGEVCVVRGSHRRAQPRESDGRHVIDASDIVPVTVRPGTALIWRTALLHALRPNLSTVPRRCLYYGYHPRWIRPSDYDRQTPQTLEGCSPIQRQLLGELGTGKTNYSGDDPEVHPISLYWRPTDEDIPLRQWAQEQRKTCSERHVKGLE
jgi:ectoine hydroxylase-related dioxygenase (phytanoyl-CoA dioxygenase family)